MVNVLGFWALRFGFRRSHSDYPGEACGSGLRVSGLGARGFRIYLQGKLEGCKLYRATFM